MNKEIIFLKRRNRGNVYSSMIMLFIQFILKNLGLKKNKLVHKFLYEYPQFKHLKMELKHISKLYPIGQGVMFHPDRSHETPEFKQAVRDAVKNFDIGVAGNDVKNYKEFREAREREMWYNNKQLNTQKMKNPKHLIIGRVELSPGNAQLYSVSLPTYILGENGMEDGKEMHFIPFCKGTKETPKEERQEGVFTESLIQAALEYLQDVNVGPLQNIDTTEAIQHLKAALGCLDRRQQKRINNGTIYTNK